MLAREAFDIAVSSGVSRTRRVAYAHSVFVRFCGRTEADSRIVARNSYEIAASRGGCCYASVENDQAKFDKPWQPYSVMVGRASEASDSSSGSWQTPSLANAHAVLARHCML